MSAKSAVTQLLEKAGITINGKEAWDIKVHDDHFYTRLLKGGEIGAGESYMAGEWDCDAIDQLIYKLITSRVMDEVRKDSRLMRQLVQAKVMSYGKKSKAFEVGEKHYDTGNDLFKAMLDKRMVYTCGYWSGTPEAKNLDEAQEAKLDLVCRKIGLQKGMTVLDIGGGWGSFAKFAAEKYGASVVNITVSKEQVALANELCKGLPVENRLQDYRDVNEKFDRIVSLGMFEHVNQPNYRLYMEVANRNLKDDGLFLLHTIGANTPGSGTGWIQKYIFPNSMLPTLAQVTPAFEGLFILEDFHNFGADYDKTLMVWHENFEKAWPELKSNYSESFYRMWRLYLLSCAGTFRSRNIGLWQFVFSKRGVPGGYKSVR